MRHREVTSLVGKDISNYKTNSDVTEKKRFLKEIVIYYNTNSDLQRLTSL